MVSLGGGEEKNLEATGIGVAKEKVKGKIVLDSNKETTHKTVYRQLAMREVQTGESSLDSMSREEP